MNDEKAELRLSVINQQEPMPAETVSKRFDELGGTFGRSNDNDWVIADNTRIVSSKHGKISFADGNFYIEDTSTNGIFLDGNKEPIGKGNKTLLEDGATLQFADYIVSVAVHHAEEEAEAGEQGLIESSHVDSKYHRGVLEANGVDSPGFDPLAVLEGQCSGASDNAISSSQESSYTESVPPCGLGEAFVSPSLVSDEKQFNLGAEEYADVTETDAFEPSLSKDVPSSLKQKVEFKAPSTAKPINSMIPENWDEGEFKAECAAASELYTQSEHNEPVENTQNGQTKLSGNNKLIADPFADKQRVRLTSSEAVRPIEAARVRPRNASKARVKEGAVDRQKMASGSKMTCNKKDSITNGVVNNDDKFFELMLQKMGANAEGLNEELKLQLVSDVYEILKSSIQALMDMMVARAEFKNQFRMVQTIIRTKENNPLKFSPSAEKAIKLFFSDDAPEFLGFEEAINEAVRDIQNHQLAMISAMDEAFRDMMDTFSPQKFLPSETADNQLRAMVGSIGKGSRAWKAYQDFYDQNIIKSQNAFQIMFGNKFSAHYAKKIEELESIL